MVVQLLKEVAVEQQRAVNIVTHDSRVAPFADEVLYLEDGVIVSKRDISAARDGRLRMPEQATRWTTAVVEH